MDFKTAEIIAREQGLLLTNNDWIKSAQDKAKWSESRSYKCLAYRWDGKCWRNTKSNEPMDLVVTIDPKRRWCVRQTDIVEALSCTLY